MGFWFEETASSGHRLQWKVIRELYAGKSQYQQIQIVETEEFGVAMVLDEIMQTTTGDEFIYHEMLALVPLLSHPHPCRVLIVGGGDGGLAREVLKVPKVERVVMVEIDPMVIEVAKRFLPGHTQSLDDPRLTILCQDGAAYVKNMAHAQEKFDVILVDSTDPEGEGPGQFLYTPAFHEDVMNALNPLGVYVQHTGAPFYNPEVLRDVSRDVARLFPRRQVYWCTIPTYPGGIFTFTAGSLGPDLSEPLQSCSYPTRYYSPAIHQAAFALPPFLEELIDNAQ
ncbi:MAG: polyamine aminopropyltransferase [Sulfobacillus thermosulfidooxidans]|nr:MAG: polyamine aminopropyltransferase [Sulfobacillus thermosulfidooxidans]